MNVTSGTEIEAFQRDGVAVLRKVLDASWIERLTLEACLVHLLEQLS